jgi:hypothetical protein
MRASFSEALRLTFAPAEAIDHPTRSHAFEGFPA